MGNKVLSTLETHLWVTQVLALGSLWSCHQFPRIFTFTFFKLEGFIITWKTTFWVEFCFMSTVLGRCACHIRMHTLMSCQESLFGWHSFRFNNTFKHHHPLLDFGWKFYNYNHICGWIDLTKILTKALIKIKWLCKRLGHLGISAH